MADSRFTWLLLVSVFVIATCGLVYELVAGALASYLLGDSITQFSTVIGTYLFAMGIGSYLSRYIKSSLISTFIRLEILIGLIGGISAALLFAVFEWAASFRVILYSLVLITGILVGLEIPLLMRILKDRFSFSDLVSQIFTFDYIGALLAALLFPLVLVPQLGLIRTSFLFGLLNVAVALTALYMFRREVKGFIWLQVASWLSFVLLLTGFIFSENILKWTEGLAYPEPIVYAKSSAYQRIILTKGKKEMRLYLNGNLQFSSKDEYRYHEALVHPIMANMQAKKVLVMGGGDGLAIRELLKYPDIEFIKLVELDPAVTNLFSKQTQLTQLNQKSLQNPKVEIINKDAFRWIKSQEDHAFDAIIIDFPDPSNFSLGKLYSYRFFKDLKRILHPEGFATIQSTSPLVARKSFWCVSHTIEAVGLKTFPYHCYVPSFGEWGFITFGQEAFSPPQTYTSGLKFLTPAVFREMALFPPDMAELDTEINRLNDQALVQYFEAEWAAY